MLWLFRIGSILAGSKTGRIVAVVLAAGLISYFTIQYIQSREEDRNIIELQGQQIEKRKKIDKAIRDDPGTVDDSLQYLRERQSDSPFWK